MTVGTQMDCENTSVNVGSIHLMCSLLLGLLLLWTALGGGERPAHWRHPNRNWRTTARYAALEEEKGFHPVDALGGESYYSSCFAHEGTKREGSGTYPSLYSVQGGTGIQIFWFPKS